MQLSHTLSSMSVAFDDPNLVSSAGLVPVLGLARRCGLQDVAADALTVPSPNAAVKVAAVVAGMVAGADAIDDLDRLRHGGMGRLFTGIRAPYGYAKQGTGYGYTGVKGLNALVGVLSTPTSAPVIAGTRLRNGSTSSARGAASFVAATLATAKRCGATGLVLARMDSAFYTADVVAALHRVHLPRPRPGGDGPADRAPGQAALPPAGANQPALIEGYRHHAVFTNSDLTMLQGRNLPPRSRHRRTRHRRPEERAAGPPAIWPVRRQRRLAHPLRYRAQPDPSRRLPRLGLPRLGPTGHPPRRADQRAGRDRHLRPTAHPAPAHQLGLGTPLAVGDRRPHLSQPTP